MLVEPKIINLTVMLTASYDLYHVVHDTMNQLIRSNHSFIAIIFRFFFV